jgi:hypothetical protein
MTQLIITKSLTRKDKCAERRLRFASVMRQGFLLILLGLFLVADVEAADIRLARSPSGATLPGITIEGSIAPGDYQKLVGLALSSKGAHTVWLASPGGNLSEALRMGRFIRSLGFVVAAPFNKNEPLVALKNRANNTCSSSCFLLYAAGVSRQGSVLGLHRPSLPADEYFALGLDGAVAAYAVIREAVTGYLEEMGVPSKYTSLMLSTANSDMVWLSSEDIRTDLDGVIPEYAERLRDACPRPARPENGEYYRPVPAFSLSERSTEKGDVDCVSSRLQEMQEERRQMTVARLLQEK